MVVCPAGAQTVPQEVFGGLKWRLIGPFRGGRAIAVSGVPGSASTFYFGSVDGGIWKTTDAGMVWTPIFDDQKVGSIGALAVAPSNPNVIYAGTGESDIRSNLASGDGMYKSTDAGQTWTNTGLRDSRQISKIVVDPKNPDVVYVAVLGHAYAPNDQRGVYKSTDGGTTWKRVLDQGSEIGAADLAISTAHPNVLFAATWQTWRPPWSSYAPIDGHGTGIYRSQDGGDTWFRLQGAGLPAGDWGRTAVAVSTDGKRVYALIDAKDVKLAGLYRSEDGGNNWVFENSDRRLISRAWYFGNITVDPANPDIVYVPNVAFYRSEDGGKTITVVRGAPGGDDYHQVWIDPENSSRMVLSTDQGTTVSLNYGRTWSSWYNQPTAQIYHLITSDAFPYAIYGTQQDSGALGTFSRTDHGKITARDWFPSGASEAGYIAIDPKDPNILYLSGTYGDVSRFDLRTSFSQDITPWPVRNFGLEINMRKYRDPWVPVLVSSPADHKSLYLGTQYVMKTTDGGLNWETISPDLTGASPTRKAEGPPTVANSKERGYGVVFALAPSSLNADLIWAGSDTGLIHVTQDGGKSWKNVTPNGLSDWSMVSMIEASRFDPAEAYVAVNRHILDDQRPYLYRTRDYGASWQLVTDGLAAPAFLRSVREDPQTPGLLFAGTEFGIYVSFDDGNHWQPLQLNLPTTSVRDMVIHGDDLVVATHGRSFWVLDDITPLRQARDAAKVSDAWLFRTATAVRVDNDSFQGSPIPLDEPLADNPPNGAILNYYLKTTAKQVKLEIYDEQHKVVRAFSSEDTKEQKRPPAAIADRWFPKTTGLEKSPGMHRFVWNLEWNGPAPRNSDADPGDYGAPRGPRVTAGTYEVRLTVDGKSWSQSLKIEMDPRSPATVQDLDQQFQMARQMYTESLLGRRAAAEIHSVQKQLADLQPKLTGNSEIRNSTAQLLSDMGKILSAGTAEAKAAMGLDEANSGLSSALRVVESGDRTAPTQAHMLYQRSRDGLKQRLAEWKELKNKRLQLLAEDLKKAGLPPLSIVTEEEDAPDFSRD